MIMPHLHYSENGIITSCNPTIKRAENKLVSAVIWVAHTELFSGNHINHIPSWKRIRSILDTSILPDEEVA